MWARQFRHAVAWLRRHLVCVLDHLFKALNNRDVFASPSQRWSDPRARLLDGKRQSPGRRHIPWQAGGMALLDDQELSTAIQDADSSAWSVRGAAGRQLAGSDKIEEVADVIHRLVLDAQDTWVIQETAEALLERKDTIGLRYVRGPADRAVPRAGNGPRRRGPQRSPTDPGEAAASRGMGARLRGRLLTLG
ncbi:hypothetical protein [Streptacidiphilus sp. P02-A3a]|uniref:hypothetical protein n=1 Tax=Streptacidiphilus sp. P02-A3a TaxID=2704468 RepID=UPI001CDC3E42|nr:hypothetical protein [Streptacidiphilus sp. P02-A3a]